VTSPSSSSPDAGGLATRALSELSGGALIDFLAKQRWFGAKGATPRDARLADVVVLPWGNGAFAAVRVVVELGESGARSYQSYQLLVAACTSVSAEVPEHGVIATVDAAGSGARTTLYDGVFDRAFRQGLVQALSRGEPLTVSSGSSEWAIEPVMVGRTAATSTIGGSLPTAVGSAEQSNTSIVIGDVAILKLFRMLKPGVHPDVEVTRFLTTRARFPYTPALLATVRFGGGTEQSDESTPGESTVAGMVQTYLRESTDAWSYALDRGREYFTAPIDRDPPNHFVPDARRLGVTTRALHEALASDDDDPAFAPDAATPDDLDKWAYRAQHQARDALALLERRITLSDFPKERLAEAQALIRRREHYLGLIDEIDDTVGDDLGALTRVHGDYHLGQVLHTSADEFMIIDFEGEPSRPLEERREKTSPLRDVAGMLRSFAYAAATLAMSSGRAIDPRTRELRGARWERDVRQAFLEGYLDAPDDSPEILPEDAAHVKQLIALFETEKVFYELAYELNNRPSWVGIPMRGISKLLVAEGR